MSNPETILDAALFVAREFGAYVFPVDHPDLPKCAGMHGASTPCDGKRGKHNVVKYRLEAANGDKEIAAWFAGATRNYGVATAKSRLLVIDEDTATLAAYAERVGQTVPETFTVTTGQGHHLWFRLPGGVKLTNARGPLPKGIDVRAGSEGYVIGPGSRHASGVDYTATWDRRVADAPQWLIDALTPPPEEPEPGPTEDVSETAPRTLPAKIQAMLDKPVDASADDRSELFFSIVAEFKRAGLSKRDATLHLMPWCERVGKYKGRVAEQVTTCWRKLPEPGQEPEEKVERKSAATVLVEIAAEQYEFGTSESGEPFAVPRTGPRVVQMLRGGKTSLRSQLARTFFTRYGSVAAQQALADALQVVEGMAQDNPEQELCLRVAEHQGAFWLDLGDTTGRAVRITSAGWTVEAEAPVLFRRTALNGSLPVPVRGGTLDELWAWLNVTEEDRPLVAAFLVLALRPGVPHPVFDLSGEQGTGKTTAQKVLVKVLDPGPVPNRKPPRDADSWVTAASGSWIVGLDNLSDMPDWLSDSICRAVTGDGDVRRRLYTDGELAVFAFRRVVVITGIDLGAVNGDLAERMLSVHLDAIPESERLEEGELWPGWNEAHPRILGAVLDLAASVARVFPSVRLRSKPRMADFARVLACVDEILGTQGFSRYMAKSSEMASEALTGDPFIVALTEALTEVFHGTSTQLLNLVTPQDEKRRPPKDWPANARVVTQRLRRQAPPMRKAGWTVEEDGGRNKGNVVRWTIASPEMDRTASSPSSPSSPEPSGQADLWSDPASLASQARQDHEPSLGGCPDCGQSYESIGHQIDCEGLDA